MKILLATLALLTVAHAQERFRSGYWEIISKGGDKPGTTRVCITPAAAMAANGPEAMVRANAEKTALSYNMKVKNFSVKDNTITMVMVSGADVFISTATYKGDSYDSTIISKTNQGEVTKSIKGTRVGPCP